MSRCWVGVSRRAPLWQAWTTARVTGMGKREPVPPGAPEPRVTLTLPALAGAKRLRLLINGAEKRDALDRALAEPDPLAAPVAAVLSNARSVEVHWAP